MFKTCKRQNSLLFMQKRLQNSKTIEKTSKISLQSQLASQQKKQECKESDKGKVKWSAPLND
jgi:hypothetical protein